jgi:hypothetical protein
VLETKTGVQQILAMTPFGEEELAAHSNVHRYTNWDSRQCKYGALQTNWTEFMAFNGVNISGNFTRVHRSMTIVKHKGINKLLGIFTEILRRIQPCGWVLQISTVYHCK